MARFSNLNSFITGRISTVTSGTPVQGAANVIPPGVKVVVKARSANTGTATIGNSSANALNTGTTAFRLLANQSVELEIVNTDRIWIDSTIDAEGIEFIFEN